MTVKLFLPFKANLCKVNAKTQSVYRHPSALQNLHFFGGWEQVNGKISVMHFGGWHRLWWLTPHVRQITYERQERDVGKAGVGLCTLWGHRHLSRKDALMLPPLLHPSSGGGRVPWGLGVVRLLGCLFPPRGVRHRNAQTCRMKSHLAVGHTIFRSLCFAGQLNKDVTYSQLYSFLDCLQVRSADIP